MIKLSVNVNKVATLRNSRGGSLPHVAQVAHDCLLFGAQGITVHPRPDGRHIRPNDVCEIKQMIQLFNQQNQQSIELNVEGFPSKDFLELIQSTSPHQVTLVPDPPDALTSQAGWKLSQQDISFLKPLIESLFKSNIRVSLFVDPYDVNPSFLKALNQLQPYLTRVELFTEKFATSISSPQQAQVINTYKQAATSLSQIGMELNAGHDLSLKNIHILREELPEIKEVSIGHALICEALYQGLEKTIQQYIKILQQQQQQHRQQNPISTDGKHVFES